MPGRTAFGLRSMIGPGKSGYLVKLVHHGAGVMGFDSGLAVVKFGAADAPAVDIAWTLVGGKLNPGASDDWASRRNWPQGSLTTQSTERSPTPAHAPQDRSRRTAFAAA